MFDRFSPLPLLCHSEVGGHGGELKVMFVSRGRRAFPLDWKWKMVMPLTVHGNLRV